jgi:hypothetical protein
MILGGLCRYALSVQVLPQVHLYSTCASVKWNHVVVELHSEEVLVELTFQFHPVEFLQESSGTHEESSW